MVHAEVLVDGVKAAFISVDNALIELQEGGG